MWIQEKECKVPYDNMIVKSEEEMQHSFSLHRVEASFNMISCIIIPYDDTIPLKLQTKVESSSSIENNEIQQHHFISEFVYNNDFRYNESDHKAADISDNLISTLLIRSRPRRRQGISGRSFRTLEDNNTSSSNPAADDDDDSSDYPSLFAYHIPQPSSSSIQQQQQPPPPQIKSNTTGSTTNNSTRRRNIRATRFAMACGHWSIRFYGTVVITPTSTSSNRNKSTNRILEGMFHEIQTIAGHCGPDLRNSIIEALLYTTGDDTTNSTPDNNTTTTYSSSRNDTSSRITDSSIASTITEWIGNAAQEQYHDRAIVHQFQQLFATNPTNNVNVDDNDDSDSQDVDTNETDDVTNKDDDTYTNGTKEEDLLQTGERKYDNGLCSADSDSVVSSRTAITNNPLRQEPSSLSDGIKEPIHNNDMDIWTMTNYPTQINVSSRPTFCYTCRRPATTLCSKCNGVYFCNDICQMNGWSHDCLCSIWKIYTDRRDLELSNIFPSTTTENKHSDNNNNNDLLWYESITKPRECQLSSTPYITFLSKNCNVNFCNNSSSSDNSSGLLGLSSWWNTELDGWNYGQSMGACQIDVQQRRSYRQGFDPISEIPIEENVFRDPNFDRRQWRFNDVGLLQISSWTEYYQLRHIPYTSPIALLMTYPLTLYYAIVQYGIVPCTIAYQIEHRPLRIHIVGVEKELNFLDIYKELAYLLPSDFHVELVFCIRPDMIPISLVREQSDKSIKESDHSYKQSSKMLYSVSLIETIQISVVCGIYGDESSLHPNFDCGSGPPDMIMAYNAGLYAYESWRYMINYLYRTNTNAIGVCSDYNEHSAVQCAAILGGRACQNSVIMNPFRQPRAMPVYSMNLPQYSNGFLYVVNEQSLE